MILDKENIFLGIAQNFCYELQRAGIKAKICKFSKKHNTLYVTFYRNNTPIFIRFSDHESKRLDINYSVRSDLKNSKDNLYCINDLKGLILRINFKD